MGAKKKIIIFLVIFGAFTVLLVIFVIFPLVRGIENSLKEIVYLKKELLIFKGETGRFNQFKATYEKIEPDLKKINQLFVDREVPVNLIEFLEKTAAGCNLSISISPFSLEPKKDDPWGSLGFQVETASSFSDFSRFLEKIERGPYLIETERLVLNKLEEKKESNNIKATLLVKVFSK